MQDDNVAPNVTTDETSSANIEKVNGDEKVRWFLVRWVALLTLLVFIAFLLTRDVSVLFVSTVFGVPISFVFAYYFPKAGKH